MYKAVIGDYMKTFIFIILVLTLNVSAHGQLQPNFEWYVSSINSIPAGNDKNNGGTIGNSKSIVVILDDSDFIKTGGVIEGDIIGWLPGWGDEIKTEVKNLAK